MHTAFHQGRVGVCIGRERKASCHVSLFRWVFLTPPDAVHRFVHLTRGAPGTDSFGFPSMAQHPSRTPPPIDELPAPDTEASKQDRLIMS